MAAHSYWNQGQEKYPSNYIEDPAAVFAQYSNDSESFTIVLERLIELQSEEFLLKLLRAEKEKLLADNTFYQHAVGMFVAAAGDLRQSCSLEPFIRYFGELLAASVSPFQQFLICRTISSLTARHGRFLSKHHAIRYFRCVSILFKKSSSFYNYLNCLNILEDLEPVTISEEEFVFLKKCAAVKKEAPCRELLAGLKAVPLDKMLVGKSFGAGKFVGAPMWTRLIEVYEKKEPIPFDIEFLGFIKRNGFTFTCKDGMVTVGEYEGTGFATKVFDIARRYEPDRVVAPVLPREEIRSSAPIAPPKPTEKEDKPVVKPEATKKSAVPQFADNFRVPFRKFKWLSKHADFKFTDGLFEERNKNRRMAFDEKNVIYEARRSFLISKKETVDQLYAELQAKLAENRERERLESLERQRKLDEIARVEFESKSWRNQRVAANQPNKDKRTGWDHKKYMEELKKSSKAASASNSEINPELYVPPHFHPQNTSETSEQN